MTDDRMAQGRAQLEAEERFIDERGGQQWINTYVLPFYLTFMGVVDRADAQALLPDVRERAHELSAADISTMVRMQWRIQVMGTWYAIARADAAFSTAVHGAFEVCYGTLTAPALTAAVLIYANDSTPDVLRAYRDRDLERQYGASGIVEAALRRLEGDQADSQRTRDDDLLEGLLDVARQLQGEAAA